MGAGAAMVRAIGPPDHMFFCALHSICRIACEIKRHTGVAICVSGGGRICGAAARCGGEGSGRECALFVLLWFLCASTMPSMLPNPALCHACFFCGPATTPPACAFACALPRCISLAGGVFSISKNLTFFKSDIQHNIQYHVVCQKNAREQS